MSASLRGMEEKEKVGKLEQGRRLAKTGVAVVFKVSHYLCRRTARKVTVSPCVLSYDTKAESIDLQCKRSVTVTGRLTQPCTIAYRMRYF